MSQWGEILGKWRIVFTRVFSSIQTFRSLNACSSITCAHSRVPTSSIPSSGVAAEGLVSTSSDFGKFVEVGRGRAAAMDSRSQAGSEEAAVDPSPDMASEASREPVGGLGDGRKDYTGAV